MRLDGLQSKADIICWLLNQGATYPVAVKAKNSDIAKFLCMGERTFKRHVQDLFDLGFVAKVPSSQHSPNAYCLFPDSFGRFQVWLTFDCNVSFAIEDSDGVIGFRVCDLVDFIDNFFDLTD